MLLPRLQTPSWAAITSIGRRGSAKSTLTCVHELCSGVLTSFVSTRRASHKAQGAVNKAKDGPGKRLGAKKSGGQYVIPGNIIFRQRGTHWFPGENCAMGRDHTIYATEPGYVKYYKDPERHPRRQYIGIVLEHDQVLPLPRNAARRRRLGMVATKMEVQVTDPVSHMEAQIGEHGENRSVNGKVKIYIARRKKGHREKEARILRLRQGYMYREGNWEIGRVAERANVKVREYERKDRWAAWRRATKIKAMRAAKMSLGKKRKANR